MNQRIVRVSSLVHYLKGKLDQDKLIQNILVQGEISNFTNHRSGHWYFTLKDETSRISCVMFHGYAKLCDFVPQNGDKILLQANTSVFESSGSLQLYGIKMQLDGQGDLHRQFEELKRKLNDEGLFAKDHKKKIPAFPMRIGLVTGRNTAAREDVISTLNRRWPCAEVFEYATLVQGDSAPLEIVEALEEADLSCLDVILLVRGGGSLEDLWAFNSELVARKIYQCITPIIAGIGHEVDVTIADFVADLRAATPTGAAELATPVMDEVLSEIQVIKERMIYACKKKNEQARKELERINNMKLFIRPESILETRWMRLDLLMEQLLKTEGKINELQNKITVLKNRMSMILSNRISLVQQELTIKNQNLKLEMDNKMKEVQNEFVKTTSLLDAYSPLKSLARGYSLTYFNETLIDSVEKIKLNQIIEVVLNDGRLMAEVIKKEKNHG